MKIPNIYESKHYKLMLIVPILLLVASLFLIFTQGVPQGVDLKGGLLITVFTSDGSVEEFKQVLPEAEVRSFSSPVGQGFELELPNDPSLEKAEESYLKLVQLDRLLSQAEIDRDVVNGSNEPVLRLQNEVNAEASVFFTSISYNGVVPSGAHEKVVLVNDVFSTSKTNYRESLVAKLSSVANIDSYSFKEVGSSLSKFFLSKTTEIVIWSFILSAILVFIVFRKLVSSFAVVFGALVNVIMVLGAMVIFDIPLSLASVAALLMLVGFSLDTDVMLTVQVLKRKDGGTAKQRTWHAMKTGIMMNITTIAAFGVLMVLAVFLQIPTYFQIGAIAVLGGFFDFIATWMGNAVFILWSTEGKAK